MTRHHVEIHVETHHNIEIISEEVRFDDLDRSYKIKKKVPRFQHLHFYKNKMGCLKLILQINHDLKSYSLCVAWYAKFVTFCFQYKNILELQFYFGLSVV